MKYDFETVVNRTNTGSEKWDGMKKINPNVSQSIIPFSVADMEFKNAPEIITGLQQHLSTALLGYTGMKESYMEAVIHWQKKRHHWVPKREWLITSPGVVPAIFHLVRALTTPNDSVMIMPPVYYPFYRAVSIHNRILLENKLIIKENRYEIDFDDFERKAKLPQTKVFILCNPHNPVGRVWTKEELKQLISICVKYNVFIISDEIHNDLILPGYKHTTLISASDEIIEQCAICTAPSKTFNLAGMQVSNIYIPNKAVREAFHKQRMQAANIGLNCLAYEACEIAYTKCEDWLEQLIAVLDRNRMVCEDFFANYMPEIKIFRLEGTYLQWMDFRAMGMDYKKLEQFMQQKANLFLDEGYIFGEAGQGFERINIACPTSALESGLHRLLIYHK